MFVWEVGSSGFSIGHDGLNPAKLNKTQVTIVFELRYIMSDTCAYSLLGPGQKTETK